MESGCNFLSLCKVFLLTLHFCAGVVLQVIAYTVFRISINQFPLIQTVRCLENTVILTVILDEIFMRISTPPHACRGLARETELGRNQHQNPFPSKANPIKLTHYI